jgi:hypothetical protein
MSAAISDLALFDSVRAGNSILTAVTASRMSVRATSDKAASCTGGGLGGDAFVDANRISLDEIPALYDIDAAAGNSRSPDGSALADATCPFDETCLA